MNTKQKSTCAFIFNKMKIKTNGKHHVGFNNNKKNIQYSKTKKQFKVLFYSAVVAVARLV